MEAEPSTPRPTAEARGLELAGRTDPRRQHHVRGRAMADADARLAQPRDLLRIEMNAVGEPDAARHPAGFLEQVDRPQAVHLEAEALFVLGLAQVGVKLAIVALGQDARSRSSAPWRSRTANRARARREFARPASGRGTASAPVRCRRGSSLRPAPRCQAAGRRPFSDRFIEPRETVMRIPRRSASSTSMSTAFSRPSG